jgi:tetratricopeptide (TPR) repeat protein
MAFLLGVLSVALVGTLSGFFVLTAYMRQPRIPSPVPSHPGDALRRHLFQQAKNLIREEKWVEAKARLLELQALAPEDPAIGDYLARVEQEIPNQEHLTAAKTALAAKMLAVAKAQLDQVSAGTTMFERVTQLKRELRDTADARVREAQSLLDAGQREQALAIFADVVAAFPDHLLARAGLERAQSFPFVDSGSAAWDLVVRDFVQGGISSAVALAEACAPQVPRCKSGLKDLKEFSRLLKKMEDLNPDQLTRLVVLDRQITGAPAPSRATEKVRARQAHILYKNASSARATGAWPRAMEFARRTLQVDPSHRGAAVILEELRSKAPPDDEVHQKAKSWAEKLDPEGKTRR